MTNEPENMNQNKPDEQGASPKPKKKNLIAVFRPQNSKTGMVKPDQRPGTGKKPGILDGVGPCLLPVEQGNFFLGD